MTDRRKPETKLGRAVVDAVEALGVPIERIQSGIHPVKRGFLHCAKKGTPDYVTPLGWLELKLPGEKPTAEQLEWHQRWANHGVRVAVVTSAAEAVAVLRAWMADHRR